MNKQNLKDVDPELYLKACLGHIAQEIERSNHLLAEEDFRGGLQELLKKSLSNTPTEKSSLSYLAMMLEGLVYTTAKITVTMAGIDPITFEKTGVLSADQVKLLRRGIEDSIVELISASLKRYVLDQHLELTEFKEEKEKERK